MDQDTLIPFRNIAHRQQHVFTTIHDQELMSTLPTIRCPVVWMTVAIRTRCQVTQVVDVAQPYSASVLTSTTSSSRFASHTNLLPITLEPDCLDVHKGI